MALRVLLADESTTIKKVMQLALQDFAVEVKAVHAGIDVLDVARTFQPDIVFADVLLQKKNGYEVCSAIKGDGDLKSIPVVLMWSSFMDLDEANASSCGADARLEKPFDVETLRKQVLELVPKTRSQRLATFLEFSPRLNAELIEDPTAQAPAAGAPQTAQPAVPQTPPPQAPRAVAPPPTSGLGERLAARAAAATATQSPAAATPARKGPPPPDAFLASHSTSTKIRPLAPETPAAEAAPSAKSTWSMESFEDPSRFEESEEFAPLELSQIAKEPTPEAPALQTHEAEDEDEAWARQDLSQFKLDLPPISVGEGREGFNIDMGEEEFTAPGLETEEVLETVQPPPQRRAPPQLATDDESMFGNDLTLDAGQIDAASDEVALPLEPVDESPLEITHSGAPRSSATPPPGFGQMNAQDLERVIRAQSREIIEQVVRKIVPDLAASIIREELERLLEDTAVRENRNL